VKLNAQRFRNTIDSAVPGGLATTPGYRYVAFRRALVAAGQLLSTDAVIPADDTKVIHLIIDLPSRKPRFMEAALRIQMAFVQTVRLSLVPVGHPTGCRSHQSEHTNDVCVDFEKAHRTYTSAVVTEWKIPRRTWLARLTSDQRYVLAAVVQARGPFCYVQTVPTNWCPVLGTYFGSDTPYVFATANAGSGNADRADPGRLGKYYFVSLVTATGVAQIPPAPKAKTSGASVSKP
jgi:hypothetical protein